MFIFHVQYKRSTCAIFHRSSISSGISVKQTMKAFVFLALFAFCLLCNEVRSSETRSGQSSASEDEISDYPQLRQNAYIIADLEDRIQKLRVKLNSLSSAPSIKKIYDDITLRVKRLEGTGCNYNEFQCGGNMRQCVSEMLACDGVKDCTNGKDEDPAICDMSALKPAIAYTASVSMYTCYGGGIKNYFFRTDLQTVHRSKIYPPLLTFTEEFRSYLGEKMISHVVQHGEIYSGSRREIAYTPDFLELRRECLYPLDNLDQKLCASFKRKGHIPCSNYFIAPAAKPYC